MTEAVLVAEDRSMAVPDDQIVVTGHVPVHATMFACRDRMAIGDVERAYRRLLCLGDRHPWPCPRGHWAGEHFVVVDGRHEVVAALMLGREDVLVAWTESRPEGQSRKAGD